MRIEVTNARNVQTGRGPMVVAQILCRTESGVSVAEQWFQPNEAPTIGVYEADVEVFVPRNSNNFAASFRNLKRAQRPQAATS